MPTVSLVPSLTTAVPEPDATANPVALNEHDTTGSLPVGFEFERCGVQYDRFDLSTDGFVRFASHPRQGGVEGCLTLAAEGRRRLGRGRVAYEVRGSAPRRRLVVSFAELGSPEAGLQLIVYERTGIVEVREGPTHSLGDPTIRQLDIAQPSGF
ncbi:MAG: hypothetical protein H0T50_14970 [Gemmatimonadales bacterium]|nr:hypothetical protein [Gemmatimonadales bacterium]